MQSDKIQEIVKLVIEEIGKHEPIDTVKMKNHSTYSEEKNETPKIKLYSQSKAESSVEKREVNQTNKPHKVISLYNKDQNENSKTSKSKKEDEIKLDETVTNMEDRLNEEYGEYLKYTPARVAVGRAGSRPKTSTLLKFRFDHAAAVDAVYGEVSQDILDKLNLFTVKTKVEEKEVYIRRPDLGRRLSDESKQLIKEKCEYEPTVQIIASNGLSASALNENLEDVYLSLQQSLKNLNISVGTPFYAHQGRVSLMDDVGEVLQPEVVINLIGERPGLVSAESMSAYLCYKPRHGTIESDRMVVSNIHKGGIPPIEAGAYLGTVIKRILTHQASGVNLIQKEG